VGTGQYCPPTDPTERRLFRRGAGHTGARHQLPNGTWQFTESSNTLHPAPNRPRVRLPGPWTYTVFGRTARLHGKQAVKTDRRSPSTGNARGQLRKLGSRSLSTGRALITGEGGSTFNGDHQKQHGLESHLEDGRAENREGAQGG